MTMLLSQPAILSTFSPVEISYITLGDKQYITVYISCQWVNVKMLETCKNRRTEYRRRFFRSYIKLHYGLSGLCLLSDRYFLIRI